MISLPPRVPGSVSDEAIPLLGAHLSIAGGKALAIERAVRLKCNVLQIFVKNASRWKAPELRDEEVEIFQRTWRDADVKEIAAHDSYLINLASPSAKLWRKSLEALSDEMDRARRLGLGHLVTHPGAHMGRGESWAAVRIGQALDRVLERCPATGLRIALETTAGQGTNVGYRFEHLRDILSACRHPEKIDVCLDTCHVFAAGYNIHHEEGYFQTMEQFDRIVGLHKLRLIHLNDSRRELGSRVDRHAHIGQGLIGVGAFRRIMNDPRLQSLPKILETPKDRGAEDDARNLGLLRSLVTRNRDFRSQSRKEAT